MIPFIRNFLKLATAGALVAIITVNTPASAHEFLQNLGPVGPHDPMVTTVGSKRVVAFYVRGLGTCNVQAMIWDLGDVYGNTATGVRVSLGPGETAAIANSLNKALAIKCGDNAGTLTAIDTDRRVRLN